MASPSNLITSWTALLIGPFAWALNLALGYTLTPLSCRLGTHAPVLYSGIFCIALTLAGHLLMRRKRASAEPDHEDFVLELARWTNPLFMLVIVLSTVAVFFLQPCPV